jgi:hypothetical protein
VIHHVSRRSHPADAPALSCRTANRRLRPSDAAAERRDAQDPQDSAARPRASFLDSRAAPGVCLRCTSSPPEITTSSPTHAKSLNNAIPIAQNSRSRTTATALVKLRGFGLAGLRGSVEHSHRGMATFWLLELSTRPIIYSHCHCHCHHSLVTPFQGPHSLRRKCQSLAFW